MKRKLLFLAVTAFLAISHLSSQTLYVPGGTGGISTSTITGNVGIGISNPSNKLQVYAGSTSGLFIQTDNEGPWAFQIKNSSATNTGLQVYQSNIGESHLWNNYPTGGLLTIAKNGNIGIGTNTPNNKFQVGSNTYYSGNDLVICNNNGALAIHNDVSDTYLYGTKDISVRPGNGVIALYAKSNGYIGIGTSTPDWNLTVNGCTALSGSRNQIFHLRPNSGYAGYIYWAENNVAERGILGFNAGSGDLVYRSGGYSFNNGTERFRVTSTGNFLIGKDNQSNTTYKLDVAGPIRANEIVVNTTGADFVFEPTYKLRSLSELETFIRTNKHLPDIAPAKEMEENGVSAGEMQAKLLQKVEELTLYVIELKKENEELKIQNQTFQNRLNEVETILKNRKK